MLEIKYAPKNLDELHGVQDLIAPIKKMVRDSKELNNLLLVGQSGTGKTTTANCIKNELYGERTRNFWFEINGSEENGTDVVREKIIEWCRRLVPRTTNGPHHKTIFIDEFDYMTPNAQAILRKAMETYSNTTRFILACNYKTKVIDAIQSRCDVYDFNKLSYEDIENRLRYIIEQEQLTDITEDMLKSAILAANGDLRKSIKNLESLHNGKVINSLDMNRNLLKTPLKELYGLSYTIDHKIMFTRLHEEIIALNDKGYKIAPLLLILAKYEYQANMSTIGTLQLQACLIEIKKQLRKMVTKK